MTQHGTNPTRDGIFISYSHRDEDWMLRLLPALKTALKSNAIAVWSDRDIQSGDHWPSEILRALSRAKVAVLLVSKAFLESRFITAHERPRLLDDAFCGKLNLVWLPLSACDFENSALAEYQAASTTPLDTLPQEELEREIDRLVTEIKNAWLSPTKPALGLEKLLTTDSKLSPFSLDRIVREKSTQIVEGNLRQIVEEKLDYPLDFGVPALLYGPPNVGKTCWAIRHAWNWMQHHGSYSFLLNASRGDSPDDLIGVSARLAEWTHLLFIVDDIHFDRKRLGSWADAVEHVTSNRSGSIGILWVARDASVASELVSSSGSVPSPLPIPFPVERVLALFMDRLERLETWQRIVAAFETRLDPQIARFLQGWSPPDLTYSPGDQAAAFIDSLQNKLHENIHRRLTEIELKLGLGGYQSYLKLLPFGASGRFVEEDALPELGIHSGGALQWLLDSGRAVRRPLKGSTGRFSIALTEHPFQIRRTLEALEAMPVAKGQPHTWVWKRFSDVSSTLSVPEAVFGLYLSAQNKNTVLHRIEDLANHAEWAGVREPLADALGFVLACKDWTGDGDVRSRATVWYRKLTRTSFPRDERRFAAVLAAARSQWETERAVAMAASEKTAGGTRLDTILYEIAYIDYLNEHYETAAETFGLSVAAGLEAISRGMTSPPETSEWRNGAGALAHIWVSGLLERSATLRALLWRWTDGDHRTDLSARMEELAGEIALIHSRLAAANAASVERSDVNYTLALQAIHPKWTPPTVGIPYRRREEMRGPLGRHELNAWLHALETSAWPALFGVRSGRVLTAAPQIDDPSYRPTLAPPAPSVGLPDARRQGIGLLCRWAQSGPCEGIDKEIISIAALTMAGGGFEYLGDVLLLAWRCASSPQVADTLTWYLEHRIPTIGFNGLPKAALRRCREGRRGVSGDSQR